MKYRTRIYYTESQKALMWERWKKGDSLQQIAQLFDRSHSSVNRILAETGGIRPPQRSRSQLALSLAEREEISRALVAGQSIRSIASRLGRAPSTISREIQRNGGQSCYRATQADQATWDRAHRPKRCKLVQNRGLAHIVAGKLQLQFAVGDMRMSEPQRLPLDALTGLPDSHAPRARPLGRRQLQKCAWQSGMYSACNSSQYER